MHIYGIFEWIPYCCIVFTYKILLSWNGYRLKSGERAYALFDRVTVQKFVFV